MSFVGLDLAKNISYFTVPGAFLVSVFAQIVAITSGGKAYDNAQPSTYLERVGKSEELDKETKQRITRAKRASENGFETLGFYAAAILAANQVGMPVATLNTLSLAYLASRFVYAIWYIYISANRRLAAGRSVIWQVGVIITITIWVKAGLKAMEQ